MVKDRLRSIAGMAGNMVTGMDVGSVGDRWLERLVITLGWELGGRESLYHARSCWLPVYQSCLRVRVRVRIRVEVRVEVRDRVGVSVRARIKVRVRVRVRIVGVRRSSWG